MDREVSEIASQIKKSFEGPCWHGPGVWKVLEGVTAAQAAQKPLPEAHSIWELLMHVVTWERAVLRGIRGGVAQLENEENFPSPKQATESEWRQAISTASSLHAELCEAVARLTDAGLDGVVKGQDDDYTLRVMLYGAVHHALYHAGQISLLRKGL